MCGIVGYIGNGNAKDIIIAGLKTLEYRGYDSSGLALIINNKIEVSREVGRIVNLEALVSNSPLAHIGIGHTRWATHGKPSTENSHPHTSMNAVFTIVHNGVIENYLELKEMLINKGYTFSSETDTEVIANYLEDVYASNKDVQKSIQQMMVDVHGSYALGIMCSDYADTLYCAKNKTPMLAGVGEDFMMIGSDAMAMIAQTNRFIEINDLEYLEITQNAIKVFSQKGELIERESFISDIDNSDVELGIYPHFMLKEIDEQPSVIRRLIQTYLVDENGFSQDILDEIKAADRLYIIASGTSMHAGLIGKHLIETMANIPVEVHIGSEFGYHMPYITEKPLFIFITQSGETADSRVALQKVKKLGYRTLTITNVFGSTLSREADNTLLLHAGPEIAVASTKAYVAQVALLAIIANKLADKDNQIDMNFELSQVATVIDEIVARKEEVKALVEHTIVPSRNCFYLGRLLDYGVAVEAALKLKEISYIQTEGFASGELKHGTIALIEEGTPVVALISQSVVALNTRSGIEEVKARGALGMIISTEANAHASDDFIISNTHELLSPLTMVVVTQLIAYYVSLLKDLDIDKPRNLAKSVTVE